MERLKSRQTLMVYMKKCRIHSGTWKIKSKNFRSTRSSVLSHVLVVLLAVYIFHILICYHTIRQQVIFWLDDPIRTCKLLSTSELYLLIMHLPVFPLYSQHWIRNKMNTLYIKLIKVLIISFFSIVYYLLILV